MNSRCGRFFYLLTVAFLIALLPIPQDVFAQDHVVSTADLHQAVVAAAQTRQNNLVKVQNFFATDQARKALQSAHLPYQKVQKAVASLNDAELARLAARTDQMQKDFAAGNLTNQQITYIIIALATAVIILIIVAAR